MAAFLMRRQTSKGEAPNGALLPPTLDEERVCKKCYAADACMLYRRVSPPFLGYGLSYQASNAGSRRRRGQHQ